MASYPRPHFFISRPDHTITPLIAVDELPSHVRIEGVKAVMTQAETQAMMSLGVKERNVGHYEVHVARSSSSTSCGEQATSTPSEVISTSDKPFGALDHEVPDKEDVIVATNLVNAPDPGVTERPESLGTESDKQADLEVTQDQGEAEELADVEKWRQGIDASDDTQARIDALLAASEEVKDVAGEDARDEHPRQERAKAGLVPGKKVYCTHWIRTGECDFIQQGCLYKHEMPDGATLKAIGYHALPPWYVTAHPEKARERGYARPDGTFNRYLRGRPVPSAAMPSGSFRYGPQAQHPSFHPSQPFGFRNTNGSLNSPSGFPWPTTQAPFYSNVESHSASSLSSRIQELSEQQYQQWEAGRQNHTKEVQLIRRPYRSPGYNTFPFQPPSHVPSSESSPELSQTKPAAPVWEPRQSKLAHGPASHDTEKARLSPSQDHSDAHKPELAGVQPKREAAEAPTSGPSSTAKVYVLGLSSKKTKTPYDIVSSPPNAQNAIPAVKLPSRSPAINTIFAALEPSPPLPKAPVSLRQERKAGISSDLFASAPKVIPPPAHRRFVPHGEERRTSGPKVPEATKRILRNDIKRAAAASPENQRMSGKRAAKGRYGSSVLLMDLESRAGD
ncbi:MAG: hypothetical protein Q9218_001261 [Villophora microphyllina]